LNEAVLSVDKTECEVNEGLFESVESRLLGKVTRNCRQGYLELKELMEAIYKGQITGESCF
jgi:hypothetical protein